MTRYQFPCGCVTVLDFAKGERLCRCSGGGETPTNGTTARESLRRCPGGRQWCVTAEEVPTVRYHATELRRSAS